MTLLAACALTVAAETLFFALAYRRDAAFLGLAAAVNVATNLLLNLSLPYWARVVDVGYFIYALEALVVAAEYLAYALALGPSRRLLGLTLAANALSYGAGLLLFGHV